MSNQGENMKVVCNRCDAGPYKTLPSWENHLACHREADAASEAASPGAKERLAPWIQKMEKQEREVQSATS